MAHDQEKFKRLVHYVIWRAGKRDWFGATKLNKVLWFADARAYVLTGKPITGARYTRQEYGPCPRAIMPTRDDLVADGAIRIVQEGPLTRFVALVAPDTGIFTADELAAVDWWIDHISRDHTAGSISEASHDYAWEIAAVGEEIPLYACLAVRIEETPGEDAMRWGREAAARRGLL